MRQIYQINNLSMLRVVCSRSLRPGSGELVQWLALFLRRNGFDGSHDRSQ